MRAVLDTNVFVSGLLMPGSVPVQIVSAFRRGDFRLVSSEAMLAELGAVLAYPKIKKRTAWTDEDITRYVSMLRFEADVVSIDSETAEVSRDAADTMVLRTFLAGQADLLVSGDEDLLSLANQYSIISPADFVARIF